MSTVGSSKLGSDEDGLLLLSSSSSLVSATDCEICGEKHETTSCTFLSNARYVEDNPVLSRARQTLPKDLEIIRMADSSNIVVARAEFQKGTTFGPLFAKKVMTMNPLSNFPIKVFGSNASDTYHLDCSEEECCNWMCFVAPAANAKEQNLVCYQLKQEVFYTVTRTIPPGEELKVWYSTFYAKKMKMPVHETTPERVVSPTMPLLEFQEPNRPDLNHQQSNLLTQQLAENLPAQYLGARDDKVSWSCRICSVTISSVVAYAKHLMNHYKPLIGVYCNMCSRKFNNLSVLERHKKTKHPKSLAKEVAASTVENHQRISSQPMLSNATESDESMKEIFQNHLKKNSSESKDPTATTSTSTSTDKEDHLPLLDTNSLNMSDLLPNNESLMENSILEGQGLGLNLNGMSEGILMPDVHVVGSEKFSIDDITSEFLEIVPDVETIHKNMSDLECDICDKKFDKVDYLYRHLRKHTGEFICHSCLTVFARKENLLFHTCVSQKQEYKFQCPYCQKQFLLKKYLRRHMNKHTDLNNCKWCRETFPSSTERDNHKCSAPSYTCCHCEKRFVHKAHLNRHVKLHDDPRHPKKRPRQKRTEDKPVICEKCGDVFRNPYSLNQHLRSHGERLFECDVCQRKFHRISVLKQHKTTHENSQVGCEVCGKKLKSKKALDIHMLLHGNKKYQCDKCDKSFFQKCNYLKHYKQVHGEKTAHVCAHCPMQFPNKIGLNKHLVVHVIPAEFPCPSCPKSFQKESQLKRHTRSSHSGIVYRCPFCQMTARHRHSIRRHFERQHRSIREEWDKDGFVNKLAEKSPVEKTSPASANGGKKYPQEDLTGDNLVSTTNVTENRTLESELEAQVPVRDQDLNPDASSLNGEEILLEVSRVNGEEMLQDNCRDLTLNEVPRLSINETDGQLSENVLSNAYIFGDAGDIMFYVLQNDSGYR